MGKGKLEPGCARTTLSIPQVRMILHIYWTNRFQRPGLSRGTAGLRDRLARQFNVSPEVIKKIIGKRKGPNRCRFKVVKIGPIKSNIKGRMERRNGSNQ